MIRRWTRDRKKVVHVMMQNTILDIEKNRNIKPKEGAMILKLYN